ncbi:MAG: chemotaxis protein CheR [Candidatus Manganitrophaceae bacterium]|nr:MAG: chemotaxis protein CheR [Candidatus Manganitrophaceae bacterium]
MKKEKKGKKTAPQKKRPARAPKRKTPSEQPPSFEPLCVVGIGASAGGLEPLEKFFGHIPPDSGLAFVVIQHLDPHYKTAMAELIGRHTRMAVCMAENRAQIRPNTVYVIPPAKYLTIFHDALYLSDPDKDHDVRFPIDFFLRSLAEDKGHRSVCVILSGGGTDGTLGLKAIKAAGGMTMVQDEASAKYGGMLRSAVATGSVDHVLRVEEMPQELLRYVRHPYISAAPPPETAVPTFADRLDKVFMILRSQTGHDFSLYKRNTICRRIERRMAVHQFKKIEDYLKYLQQTKPEVEALFQELLIGVTNFFRDPEAFEALLKKVVPHLFEKREAEQPLRIWDAGCSTGEEAYSIAILLLEEMERLGRYYKVQIFATDIDERALEFARTGLYPEAIAADVAPQRLRRFFEKEGNSYRIKKQIREMIIFAKQDLIKDPPFSRLDLVVCRNLLIYLSGILQKRILPLFHYTLNPDGYLMLGPSETIGEFANLFSLIDKRWKIFHRKSSPRVSVEFPTVPAVKEPEGLQKRALKLHSESGVVSIAEKMLLDDYAPPSVLVNERFEIVHFRGRTGPYLEHTTGEATFNILKMVREGLRLELRGAIHKAFTRQERVVRPEIRLEGNGKVRTICLTVQPFQQKGMDGLAMVIFQEVTLPADSGQKKGKGTPQIDQRLLDLEHELNTTKESLQTTIEELETSNEELKSANEELQSTNEELQSANEEMETSKEELQSINEELVTVNSELQNKLDELSQANNDMMNLLSATEVGTIFLDSALRIKRFTPAVAKIIHLIPTDIGRPIGHITGNLVYENLVRDIEEVMRTLIFKQKELQTREGDWYLMKVFPYRTMENRIDGVIITFMNISDLKKSRLAQEALLDYTNRLIEAMEQPLVVLNKRLRILSANEAFYRVFQIQKEESDGQVFFNLAGGRMNIPALKNALERMIEDESPDQSIETDHGFAQLGRKRLKISLHKIKLKEKAVMQEEELVLLLFEERSLS